MAIREHSALRFGPPYGKVEQAWTTTPIDYDILANGPGSGTGQTAGQYCQCVVVQTAGTLVVTLKDGTDKTLTCFNGEEVRMELRGIKSTSTAQGVKVYW